MSERISERANSLTEVSRFKRSGIEGWLKVEAISALGDNVELCQNKGADLKLKDGILLELKAATDFNARYIIKGVTKYNSCCLFLAHEDKTKLDTKISQLEDKVKGSDIKLVAYEQFSAGESDWVIGLLSPKGASQ